MNDEERTELAHLRAERDATAAMQKTAQSFRDEYETLVTELERERADLMQMQAAQARSQGDDCAANTLEQLRAARMSCSRHTLREQALEHQLVSARMSCTRHKASAESLENEADMFVSIDSTDTATLRLQQEVCTLREELVHHKQQAAEAWEMVHTREARVANLDSQCSLLAAQLTSACSDRRKAMAGITEASSALQASMATLRSNPTPDAPPQQGEQQQQQQQQALLAQSESLCAHLRGLVESESRSTEERIKRLQDFERRLSEARAAAKQRDDVVQEQLNRLKLLEEKLATAVADPSSDELEAELQAREVHIKELTEALRQAEASVATSDVLVLEKQLQGARQSVSRRDEKLEELARKREEDRLRDEAEIRALQQRCAEAEAEAATRFVETEQLIDLADKFNSKRLSCDVHHQNESNLRTELQHLADKHDSRLRQQDELNRKLEAENKEYCAALYRQLMNVKAQAEDDTAVLRSELSIARKEKSDLRQEIIGLRLQAKSAEEEAEEQRQAAQQAQGAVVEVQKKLEAVAVAHGGAGSIATQEEVQQARGEANRLSQTLQERERDLASVRSQQASDMDKLRGSLLEKTVALEQLEPLRQLAAQQEEMAREGEGHLAALRDTLTHKEAALENAQQRMDRMVSEIREQQQKVASLSNTVLEREGDICALKEAAEELEAAAGKAKKAEKKSKDLEKKLRESNAKRERLQAELASHEIQCFELEGTLDKKRLSCDRRSHVLKDKSDELTDLRNELQATKKEVLKYKRESEKAAALKKDKDKEGRLMKSLSEEHEKLQSDYIHLKATHDSAMESMKDRSDEVRMLRHELKQSRAPSSSTDDVTMLRDKLDRAIAANSRLKRRLQEKTREMLNEPSPSPIRPSLYRCAEPAVPFPRLDLDAPKLNFFSHDDDDDQPKQKRQRRLQPPPPPTTKAPSVSNVAESPPVKRVRRAKARLALQI